MSEPLGDEDHIVPRARVHRLCVQHGEGQHAELREARTTKCLYPATTCSLPRPHCGKGSNHEFRFLQLLGYCQIRLF